MATSTLTKARVNVGTIGHVGHGKTTLTAAITKVLADQVISFDESEEAPMQTITAGLSSVQLCINKGRVEYETGKRHYTYVDCCGHTDYVKNMIAGASKLDGGILVVSALDGPMPLTHQQILLARQVGLPSLVCFLNKVDQVSNQGSLDRMEMEIRELLSFYKFPGNEIPIIQGSALSALQGTNDELGRKAILKLMDAVDEYIPDLVLPVDKPFLMPIEDFSPIESRVISVSGRIEQGTVEEEVEVYGLIPGAPIKATVPAVYLASFSDGVEVGKSVVLQLHGMDIKDMQTGQVIAKPGSLVTCIKFEGVVYVVRKEEGGIGNPLVSSQMLHFRVRTASVYGKVELPGNVKKVMPGDYVTANFELTYPIPLETGQRFSMKRGGLTVAVGAVSKVIG